MYAVAVNSPPPPPACLRRQKSKPELELTTDRAAGDVPGRFCTCGRRHFAGALGSANLSSGSSLAAPERSNRKPSYMEVVNKFHQARPEWYEEFYASQMNQGMKLYEDEITEYKAQLFEHINRDQVKNVLEVGIGTGPNLKFYARPGGMHVIGIDPNKQMEKYAQAACSAAGLPTTQFQFIQGIAEALPIPDESIDAVIGTLVLCSLKDVNLALQELKMVLKPKGMYIFIEHVAAEDGTFLKIAQNVLDHVQQFVADGCHLTRESGREIQSIGFSYVDINRISIQKASLISPHVLGIALK